MPAAPPHDTDPELVRDVLDTTYGLRVTALTAVTGGVDTRARTWRGSTGDGRAYAVRFGAQNPLAAVTVLGRLSDAGVLGVPVVRATRAGTFSARVGDRFLVVQDWIDGRTDVAATLSAEQWRGFGRLLRDVHDTEAGSLPAVLPGERFDLTWHDALLSEVRDGLGQGPDALRTVWAGGADRLDQVERILHGLAAELRGHAPDSVLCHTDPHLGNVVVGPDGSVSLVDWADVAWSPRERDLMFVLGGVIASAPVGPTEQTPFFAGYGPVDLDPRLITWYRGLRAIEDLALPAVEILRGAPPDDQLGYLIDVLSPTGLIAQILRDRV